MGLFSAMTTSVAGLNAQAFALQNISGNIANSQTTAYKSIDTTFADIVTSVGQSVQDSNAGSVRAISTPTNSIQGAVNATGVSTNMAINGEGYFQVQMKTGETDGSETFSGTNVYTRAGDFTMDKQGYLVNSAGAALMAIPIDPATQNPIGDTAQLLQISSGYLKANATTAINYQANLPATPTTGLLNPSDFTVNPTNAASAASVTATAAYTPISFPNTTDTVSFNVTDASNGTTYPITLNSTNGTADGTGNYNVSLTQALAAINTQLSGSSITATSSNGAIVLTSSVTGTSSGVTVGAVSGTTTTEKTDIGFTLTGQSAVGTNPTNAVEAQDNAIFQKESLAGSSTTAYTSNGSAVNVQMRWAKTSASPPTWNLFYQSNSTAAGTQAMWTNSGQSVVFNSSGQMVSPSSGKLTLSNMSVDGAQLGNVTVNFGSGGLTQYDSATGTVDVSTLKQDGYTSGSLTSVGVDSQGRVTASYTNGVQVPIAEVPLYKFNGNSALSVATGGIYVPNNASGPAIKMASTDITGGSLEASNTDIATQFSKMIVTQQAYSANSKVITTANSMMQDVMAIIR
jgi:flagellar hook protein FlgE